MRPNGTLVVNYPRWSEDVPISVAELDEAGRPTPFPDEAWNAWQKGDDPSNAWVCVQSVVIDDDGTLWVLDPGNLRDLGGLIEGAPKLVAFRDDGDREPDRIIRFAPPSITPSSYLNDVRVDLRHGAAYLTDSGDGALLVVDLASGDARRLLDTHPSTHAEPVTLEVEGRPVLDPRGRPLRIHADGIALADDGWLYYQALTGRTLYRIPSAALRDESLDDEALAARVERVAEGGASDGLLWHDGRVWISALEHDAIRTVRPGTPGFQTVVTDPRLAWPDAFAVAPDGTVLVTTSQIHRQPSPPEPYRIFRIRDG